MLKSKDAWEALLNGMPRGRWLTVSEIYDLVAQSVELDVEDQQPEAGRTNSPRWKRTVRNALQRHKGEGDIDWDGEGRFRLPG